MDELDRSDNDLNIDTIREHVGRRELLGGALTLVSGFLILSSQESSDEHLKRAESRLAKLAASIDNADLMDPQQNAQLYDKTTGAIESVNVALSQDSTDEPQIKQRIAALEAARDYYTEVEKVLDAAINLKTQVAESESTVLDHKDTLGYDPTSEPDTTAFKRSITSLSEVRREPAAATSQYRELVPDKERVLDSLRSQLSVYEQHVSAQQTYLDTAVAIEAGVRAHEQADFDAARSSLTKARKSLTAGIPTMKRSYRVSYFGLSLGQYAKLLTLRRKGVRKLLGVSEASVPVQQRRAVADESIDLFFDARQIVLS